MDFIFYHALMLHHIVISAYFQSRRFDTSATYSLTSGEVTARFATLGMNEEARTAKSVTPNSTPMAT